MKKMKRGGKVHKRMQVGGMAMDPRFAAAAAANPANAPVRGAATVGGREMPMRGGRKMMDRTGIGRGVPMRGARGPMVRPGFPSRPRGTPVDKPLPPRPSAAEGKPAFSPNVSYSQPPGATKPTPRTQDFADLSSLEKATGQSMADFRKRQAAQNAAIIGNSTGSTPVAEQPFRRRGSDVPYDDTPGVTSTPSDPGRTKYPLDSNGNYIIPTGSVLGGSLGLKKGGAVKSKAMRGGGLARKGVGMALAKGGLARRAGGCAQRGVGRGKIT